MLVFSPKDPKYTITVFTDIDCGYCRRLHSQIAEYNRLGIRVRYLFFPRSGPDTESWHKAEAVWCASNRNEALTRAKNGEDIKSPKCPTDIIKRDYELGQKLAVDGTPAIFLASGEMLPGYAPPAQLAEVPEDGKDVSATRRASPLRFPAASSCPPRLPTAWHRAGRASSRRSPATSSPARRSAS